MEGSRCQSRGVFLSRGKLASHSRENAVDIALPAEEIASSVPDTTRMRGERLKACFRQVNGGGKFRERCRSLWRRPMKGTSEARASSREHAVNCIAISHPTRSSLPGRSGAAECGAGNSPHQDLSIPRLAPARPINRMMEDGEVHKILQAAVIQIH